MINDTEDNYVCEHCQIGMGDPVTDSITGLEGVVIGIYYGIGGEELMEVQEFGINEVTGIPSEPMWFASSRLSKLTNETIEEDSKSKEMVS